MTNGKRYFILLLVAVIINHTAGAQHQFKIWGGNLGGAIYSQNFGFGDENDSVAGPSLPVDITGFSYSNSICPPPGSYSIVQKVNPKNCYGGKWLLLSSDHNSQVNHGNMMLVHNLANSSERIVYVDTVNQDLCANTVYEFSAAIINVDALAPCPPSTDYPAFRFSLEDASGTVLQSYTTPEIQASPGGTSAGPLWKFSIYGLDYTLPVNMNKVVLKIILLRSNAYNNCNNDFAIDDILFSPAGPKSKIFFDAFPDYVVTGVCFQDNKSVSMTGNMDPFYANPALQWEQSTNNGLTWEDIAGATTTSHSQSFSVPDTFLFRMRGSEDYNISKPGCGVVSNVLKVEVDGIPSGLKVTNNSPICSGEDLKFNAEGGTSYLWSGPNGFFDNIPFPHIFHSVLADSGTYYVQIITYGGCKALDSTHVIMNKGIDVTAGPDTSICKGNPVKLNCTPAASYSWSPADGLSSVSIPDPVATPQATATYTVKVSDGKGCSNMATVTVKVLNAVAVKAVISGANYICFPYDSAVFFNESLGKIVRWNWNFDNGQTSPAANPPSVKYTIENGRTGYNIRLAVADSAGCADTAYHVVKVEDNCYIAVPSAFTPNGDGINDYLYPLNAYKATQLLFRVFNRNGQLVFETRDWTKKWDGTFKGNPLTPDIFVWELGYNDASGKKIFLKGSTLLIR
jgi:gliding motility-associated-like protein